MKKYTALIIMFLSAMVLAKTPQQWLRAYYPLSVPSQPKCWGVQVAEQGFYCMQPDLAKPIHTANGSQLLVLMAGYKADRQTAEDDGGHVSSGLVGVFVFQQQAGEWRVVSADAQIPVGAFGRAPTNWTAHEFGPGRWGVLNQHGDMHFGFFGSHYVLLLPQGQGVHVNWIGASASNKSALGDCRQGEMVREGMTIAQCKAASYALDSTLRIDRTQPLSGGYYPLLVSVTGHKGSQQFRQQTYRLVYGVKGYTEPKQYPLRDVDY